MIRYVTGDIFSVASVVHALVNPVNCKWIVNFATKDDWRDLSKLDWVIGGLAALHLWMMDQNIQRIAIPALGAGLIGLLWGDVKRCIENEFANTKFDVLVFEPAT